MVGGSGAYAFQEKQFEVRMAGDGVSLDAIEAFHALGKDAAGKLSSRCRVRGRSSGPI